MKQRFNLFYKDYNTIRKPLWEKFIYFCFSREDYKRLFSGRKYDNELKRILALFPQKNIQQAYKGKKKYTTINAEYFNESENLLIHSYYAKAFKEIELQIYFCVMSLPEMHDGLTLTEIDKKLSEFLPEVDQRTVRNHLNEMVADGYLDVSRRVGKDYYTLADDILRGLNAEELKSLLAAIQLYMNKSKLRVPGHYAFRTINNYLLSMYHIEYKDIPIIFRHRFQHQILDEEVITVLLDAIKEHNTVSFDYTSQKSELRTNTVEPIKLILDIHYGRQYLLGRDMGTQKIYSYRLDRVEHVHVGQKCAITPDETLKYVWNSSLSPCKPIDVEISFCFDKEQEAHAIRRLFREKRHGQVMETGDEYQFRIRVADPMEMIPWLRTFYGNIVGISYSPLQERILKDLEGMCEDAAAIQ